MNTNIKTAAKLAAFAGAFALTGCAYIPRNVHPTYVPTAQVQKIPGAEDVKLTVVVHNDKKHHDKDLVSYTIAPAGFETAGVYMHVAKDFKAALSAALKDRGFHVVKASTKVVKLDINHFWFKAHTGWAVGHQTSYVSYAVSVISNHKIIFTEKNNFHYNGGVYGGNFHVDDENRAGEAKHLLNETINRIIDNHRLIDVLLQG
ncbi:YajG family lipoprotein [Acidithiobacillus thiooxidans]|uniref:Lipoprotein n=1 Tax=Acidithiobacillus thiooxidans ATCC 19377 TaxID=637390 RepID=A0A543Q1Y7_ACITH|nr:YajG family lipoprotein [Acidithiobacillus thiooxidans]MDX5935524.1 YajG family lipoprotein [Acidithiobacillus thiooxidans]TQN50335.1 hypothetical protein DLNHIDIE_00188 [Acidithiobacillus thiooxidans ATCC 19377]